MNYLFVCFQNRSRSVGAEKFFSSLLLRECPNSILQTASGWYQALAPDGGRTPVNFSSLSDAPEGCNASFVHGIRSAGIYERARVLLTQEMVSEADKCFVAEDWIAQDILSRFDVNALEMIDMDIPDVFPPHEFVFDYALARRRYGLQQAKELCDRYDGKNLGFILSERLPLFRQHLPPVIVKN